MCNASGKHIIIWRAEASQPSRTTGTIFLYTRGMLSIFGERERPNFSAGRMSTAFRRCERNALPFSMVFVSASVNLLIYARTQ